MVDSYYLLPPRQQLYYRVLITFTTFNGIGQNTWWGFDPPAFNRVCVLNKISLYILAPSVLTSQIVYLVKNYDKLTFNVRGAMFSIVPVTVLVNVLILSSRQDSFKNVMKDFMGKIHLCNLDQDEYVIRKRIKAEKYTRFISYFMCGFIMIDWIAWFTITGLNNYYNREQILNKTLRLETVLYTILPFDYEYNFKNWMFVHTAGLYVAWAGCAVITIHNVTNYAFIFQLIGHIEILKHKISTEFERTFTQEELRMKLIDVIKYHTFVLKIFRDIQDAFGLNVTAYYCYNLVADSLNLYQLMTGEMRNAMVYALMVFVYVGGLVVMSFVLEEVRRESDGLSEAVYNLDWEDMSVANRKMVILLLMRIQPALVFTAAGGLKAGVKPMISIARTSFSIYVMLKSSFRT